jgi:hypothetical protein
VSDDFVEFLGTFKLDSTFRSSSGNSVNFLCDHPLVKAITFVGGDIAGKHIYDRASIHGKRVQANMGAKSSYLCQFSIRFWLLR